MVYYEKENDIYPLKWTTLTDPWASDINTAMLDAYSQVTITLTTTGNSLTLWTPWNTGLVKRFTVTNNNTSTHTITVNLIAIAPWTSKCFVWDWTAWTLDVWNVVWRSVNLTSSIYITPYAVNSTVLSTNAATENNLYLIPFRTQQEHTFTDIALSYSVWVALNSINLWIYESNEKWFPTNLLAESGLMTANTVWWATVNYTFVTPITCPINKTYWLACANNVAWVTFRTVATSSISNRLWYNTAITTFSTTRLEYSLTPWWTNFPNPAPASWSYLYQAAANPAILVKHKI